MNSQKSKHENDALDHFLWVVLIIYTAYLIAIALGYTIIVGAIGIELAPYIILGIILIGLVKWALK